MLPKIDILIILTPWAIYRKYFKSELINSMKGKIILDPYKVLSGDFCKSLDIKYFTLGEPFNTNGDQANEL
jgi:hypothetical protein